MVDLLRVRYALPMDFPGFRAKPLTVSAGQRSFVCRRRQHARLTSFQAAIWAGRIGEQFGFEPAQNSSLRSAARAAAFARLAGCVTNRRRMPREWEAIVSVALEFTAAISPFEGAPAVPNHAIRTLLDSPESPRRAAAYALAGCLAFATTTRARMSAR